MNDLIIQYVRDWKNNPVGCVAHIGFESGHHVLGYSLCHPRDSFDKELAKKIAIGRASKRRYSETTLKGLCEGKAEYYLNGVADEHMRALKFRRMHHVVGKVCRRAQNHASQLSPIA